jgi:hypothetical protein
MDINQFWNTRGRELEHPELGRVRAKPDQIAWPIEDFSDHSTLVEVVTGGKVVPVKVSELKLVS